MSVWFCVPSIRPGGGSCPAWKAAGYNVAVLREGEPFPEADITIQTDKYLGWARSVNVLARAVMKADPQAEWIVSGGDDTFPDASRSPEEIAPECELHFGQIADKVGAFPGWRSTFGVMQPTGDKNLWPGSLIENFAGSPWMGREWCERAYQGGGPMCEQYPHNWADQELQEVAILQGVFWQRPDLIHRHEHWARARGNWEDAPEFAKFINGPEYLQSEPLFRERRAAGFPGHEPLDNRCVKCELLLA